MNEVNEYRKEYKQNPIRDNSSKNIMIIPLWTDIQKCQ